MFRLRSALVCIYVFALLAVAAPMAAQTSGSTWQLINAPAGGTSASEVPPYPNPTQHVYILQGDAGVADSPLPDTIKEDLLLAPAEPGAPGTVSLEEEGGDIAYIVSQEIAEGIEASEQAGQLTPEIAAIAEPEDEETEASGVGTNSIFGGSCATREYRTSKQVDLGQQEPFNETYELGDGATGTLTLEGNLEGTINAVIQFGIKRKNFLGVCVPYGVKVRNIHIYGNAASTGGVHLQGTVHYADSFGPYQIAKPLLFTYPINLYYVTISVGAHLPITTGLEVSADAVGQLNYNGEQTVSGTFDYNCTLDNCTGTSNFDNSSPTGNQTVTGNVNGRVKPTVYLDIGVRAWVYSDSLISAQIGLRPNFVGDLWGYAGNSCGDADGNGTPETVDALTFDLDRRTDITGRVSILGAEWNRTLKTGTAVHMSFWDLGGSTAMQPQLHGPASVEVRDPGAYKVKIRPCWPYTDPVTYRLNWGDGSPVQELQGTPATELTASHTWDTGGSKTVTATSWRDGHGRLLDQSYSRTVEVTVPPGLTLTVTPSPATAPYGQAITWTATATGGHQASTQYALFRRRPGATAWTPVVTAPSWQASNILSWTPAPADTGVWEIIVWVKDRNTPPDANTYGFAAYTHGGNVEVVAPLTVSCSAPNPATVTYGNPVTWTATRAGGTPGTIQFMLSRQRVGTSTWISTPWQPGNTFSWTPIAADVGTWQVYITVKDVNTPADPGYTASCNGGQPKVVAPLGLSVTPSPASSVHGNAITWTATASGGTPASTQYALFRRRAGATDWIPSVTAPAWQASNPLSWTPASSDVGNWEIIVWVKDGNTPANANTYGYAAYAHAGNVQVVTPPLTLTVTASPAQIVYGNPISWQATAGGGTPSTTRFAFFRRRSGTTPWTPDVTAPAWQTSNTFTWTPTSADVGNWDIYVWVKDGNTPANMNTYGYAAGYNPGGVQIVTPPLTLTVTASPQYATAGNAITWTATAGGGTPSTTRYALFRRRAGATAWTPDVTAPAWQAGNVLSWTTASADVGTWEIVVWVKDGDTPANQNTYGYAAYHNPGPVQVVAPLSLTVTPSPESRPHNDTRLVTWTATASGGVPSTYQYAFFRRRSGTTAWTPAVTAPSWQTSNTFNWDPGAADVGTWDTYVWVKDSATPANMNTYGYAAGYNSGPITISAPLCLSSTASPATVTTGTAITWTATPCGGYPPTTQLALFRRRVGTTAWIPDVSAPAWQSSNVFTWTPGTADTGTWEILLWVRDDDTPPSPGYGATYNPGNVQVVAPLTLSVTATPAWSLSGNAITWTATASGGIPATTQYALFRRRSGTTPWTPSVTTPPWQASGSLSWTPAAADAGTWEVYVWVKDGTTPPTMNTYGYAAGRNAGSVQVVAPMTLSGTVSPAAAYYGTPLTWTANATGNTPSTTQYAFFRRRAGTTPWTPDVTAPAWQASNVLSWTPASADAGTWETYIWVKDGNTPANMNTYGHAAWYNSGTVQIVAPPTLSVTGSPAAVSYGTTITWTASASSSNPSSLRYAFFRRRSGATAWIPAATSPSWQTSNVYSWTPTSADAGTWDTYVWVKDAYTPASMNTYGYAAGYNTGSVQIVAPLSGLSCSANPSSGSTGTTFTWTANVSGGDAATLRYALFRRRSGTTTWIPSQSAPAWQSGNVFSWTTTSSDAGTWEITLWAKDNVSSGNVACNPGNIQVLAPITVTGTGSPSSSPYGATLAWTATASGGDPSTYRYAFFRRLAGTSAWTPDVTAPSWQSSRTMSWTPTSADAGTWEIFIWVKDAYTPPTMNTYGHAAWYNAGPVQVTTPAPLTVSGTGSPSTSPAGTSITWTANTSGGVPSTVKYALFRQKAGTSNWIPDVTAPSWQSSNVLRWTPSAADVGTWSIIIWVKDVNTSPTQNGYGFAAYYNAQPVQVY